MASPTALNGSEDGINAPPEFSKDASLLADGSSSLEVGNAMDAGSCGIWAGGPPCYNQLCILSSIVEMQDWGGHWHNQPWLELQLTMSCLTWL